MGSSSRPGWAAVHAPVLSTSTAQHSRRGDPAAAKSMFSYPSSARTRSPASRCPSKFPRPARCVERPSPSTIPSAKPRMSWLSLTLVEREHIVAASAFELGTSWEMARMASSARPQPGSPLETLRVTRPATTSVQCLCGRLDAKGPRVPRECGENRSSSDASALLLDAWLPPDDVRVPRKVPGNQFCRFCLTLTVTLGCRCP